MSTVVTAETFLYSRIAPLVSAAGWTFVQDGVTLPKLFSGVALEGATHPFVVMQEQSPGTILRAIGGGRVWTDPLYLVKVIGKTMSWDAIASMADAIDAALDQSAGPAGGGTVWSCEQEQPFSQIINTNDPQVQYRHLGAMYRMKLA